jgi:hypothetical protein
MILPALGSRREIAREIVELLDGEIAKIMAIPDVLSASFHTGESP